MSTNGTNQVVAVSVIRSKDDSIFFISLSLFNTFPFEKYVREDFHISKKILKANKKEIDIAIFI